MNRIQPDVESGEPRSDREEMQAREELKRLTLPLDRLEKAAQQDYSHHPWWSGNETKPF